MLERNSKKRVFNGRFLKVFKGKKTLPDGRAAYFEEVDHIGASLIIPFAKNKIVFIRQYRAIIGKYIWELPAGVLEPGETPYVCAKRELTEETGYIAKNIKKLGAIYSTPGFSNEKIHIFRADCESKIKTKHDDNEIIKVKQLSRNEIRRLFKSRRISDSKTIAALAFAGIL